MRNSKRSLKFWQSSPKLPQVLELLKHDSKEVCERALGLVDALVSSNPLHRDAVWHHGGIPLVVQLLKSHSAMLLGVR